MTWRRLRMRLGGAEQTSTTASTLGRYKPWVLARFDRCIRFAGGYHSHSRSWGLLSTLTRSRRRLSRQKRRSLQGEGGHRLRIARHLMFLCRVCPPQAPDEMVMLCLPRPELVPSDGPISSTTGLSLMDCACHSGQSRHASYDGATLASFRGFLVHF